MPTAQIMDEIGRGMVEAGREFLGNEDVQETMLGAGTAAAGLVGSAVVAAAPVVLAGAAVAAVGYGLYALFED